jgi:hypothetical protein
MMALLWPSNAALISSRWWAGAVGYGINCGAATHQHESKQVMNVARRFDLRLAEKYHRLIIEHLEES